MAATPKDGAALPFDPFASGFNEDPYPHYRRLRAAEAVYWDPLLRAWMLTGMTEVTEVLNDETFHVFDIGKPISDMARLAGKDLSHLVRAVDAMTFLRNGDDHRTARRALGLAISRVPFRDLEPMIDEMAGKLAADLSRRRGFDAVKDFADVLPARVMTQILGLPESDGDMLKEVGDDIVRTFDIVSLGVYQELDRKAEIALTHLCKRVEDALATGHESGVTVLYEEGANATDEKVMATAALILFAFAVGSVTTSSLIAFAIDLLLARPDLYARAREDVSLAAAVAAEAGRFQSPVQRALRVATEDRMIGGKSIKRGQRLILLVGAANRDPTTFSEPDSASVPRDEGRDLVFGAGRHVCLGMNLAKIESRVTLTHFLRLPPLERGGWPIFRPSVTVRRLASVPVRFKGG
jgi:pimeloyl-[acyl-carrier protein] synthase